MRIKKDTIGSLLQGVSEQPPSRRLDGQNSAQLNMISDAISGLRRRDGLKYMRTIYMSGSAEVGKVYGTYQSTKDGYRHVIINTYFGEYSLIPATDTSTLVEKATGTSEYLAKAHASDIQSTSMSGITYILNTSAKIETVVSNDGKKDPYRSGFYYTVAGAYSTIYQAVVKIEGKTLTWSYRTPRGNEIGDADASTPEYISNQFWTALSKFKTDNKLDITIDRRGTYISIYNNTPSPTAPVDIASETSTAYVVPSGQCNLAIESLLPPRLPTSMDGFMCSVGSSDVTMVWYQYYDSKGAWIECGEWDSPADTNINTPLMMNDDGVLEHMTLEGRNAGNNENNEVPHFMETGEITGISTYSGRLVFLSGAYVAMSGAGRPKRFFRSTVTTNLGSDRVDLASGSAQNTTYRQAVQYNKDLLVIGDDAQAVIPFSTTKASDNIALVITSAMTCNSKVCPTQTLKTMLYSSGSDTGYTNILELVPSTTAASLYSTTDATSHIPRYLKGSVRFMTGSPNWGLNVIGTDGDLKSLIVHEYLFQGEDKAQNAWHKWTFDKEILWAYSGNDYIYILCKGDSSGEILMYSIDPVKESSPMSIHLDYNMEVPVSNDVGSIPTQLRKYAKDNRLVCVYNEGELKGCQVTMKYSSSNPPTTFTLDRITGEKYTGSVTLGIPYTSLVSPTTPVTKNRNGFSLLGNKEKLLRFEAVAYNTGEIYADVKDHSTATNISMHLPAVTVQSNDLELNKPLVAEFPKFTIPCRTKAQTTQVTMRTDGIHDMNIISCDYVVKKEG